MSMQLRILPVLAAGIATLAIAACGEAGGNAWAGTVRDSAGIEIVENPETGIWQTGTAWQLVEDLRIGTAEGEPEYQFGAILAIEVGDDGTIYALDQQGQHIKAFDAEGQYVRTIGRGGSGLGEISASAGGLALLRGDTLIVLDQGNARFSRFQTDGAATGSFRIDFPRTGFPFRIAALETGGMVAQMRRFAVPNAPPDSKDRVLRLSSEGEPIDTLMSFNSGNTFSAAGGAPRWEFFSPEPLWAVQQNGGVLFGVNAAYTIEIRDSIGSVERIVTKPFTPIPVTEADAERIRDAVMELIRRQAGQNVPAAQLQALRGNMNFAPNYPVIAFIAAGPEQTIWVQQIRTLRDLSEEELANFNIQLDLAAPRWDVFDATGRYLGAVNMPGRIQLFAIEDDAFYGVMRDDLDVQYIVRLRLQKPS